ncbi:hypothetical protein D0Z06_20065 [Geodermatophilus marinus]|nr:hypothetical protein D0Z06_20065 [Geodermatophilus sp. LHW52908]
MPPQASVDIADQESSGEPDRAAPRGGAATAGPPGDSIEDVLTEVRRLRLDVERVDRAVAALAPAAGSPSPDAPGEPPRTGVAVLADRYRRVEHLLAAAEERAPGDFAAAVEMRATAARLACEGLGALLADRTVLSDLREHVGNVTGTPDHWDSEPYRRAEVRLLVLAGLPQESAQALIDEAWAIQRLAPAPSTEITPDSILDRVRAVRAVLCGGSAAALAHLDQPDPVVTRQDPGTPVGRRGWWRSLRGRRLLYTVGGVLITAANVTVAGTVEVAAAGGAGGALVGVSANVGTSLLFHGQTVPPA